MQHHYHGLQKEQREAVVGCQLDASQHTVPLHARIHKQNTKHSSHHTYREINKYCIVMAQLLHGFFDHDARLHTI